MSIHPTAVVDPEAEIGPEVVVGPYCVVGGEVSIGAGCWLQNQVTICGPAKIGANNRFHCFCSIGQQTQDLKYGGEPTYLEIGDDNRFREFVTVNRGTAIGSVTRVGHRGNFLAYRHIAHDCVVGDDVIFSNNGTLAGHVSVQEHAIIGGLTAVHQYCRIGKHAITGGCSKIVQDVPPFMIADGNPAVIRGVNVVGLERRGVVAETIRVLKESYRILYRANLNTKQALQELEKSFGDVPEARELIEFIETSERGIIR
ncbi:MAG: acyl-ACP--UDP-N-acetylglucosamine O-acyltransferase [Verrucomicrobia bacterium]|nr:acyl-ACP--UDP-N-acetylglucosamine O-acyltransferase [Verrucomicrobiota bacterium]